jgi:hypothetical protein
MKNRFLTLIALMLIAGILSSQNIVITDDDAYTANSSAMLDVKSLTKGMLVPRMTSAQRAAIVTPATGLLVFDTNINGFYYYNGSAWINLSSGSSGGMFWSYTSPNIYMTTTTDKLGLGTSTPLHKIHLYESVAITDGTDGNFIDLQNSNNSYGVMSGIRFQNGTTSNTFKGGIFYQDVDGYGTGNLIIANNTTEAGGNVTASDGKLVFQRDGRIMVKGDANSGLNTAIFAVQNSDGDTVFAVYPEGVRVWVNDDGGSKASGNRGGFAVGGYSPSKAGFTNEYLRVTPDSVRVYIDDEFIGSKAAGNRGGFAVGGFAPSKGTITDHYLFVQDDSTRVYVADSMQGFGVENIQAVNDQRIMRLNTENYFIGHESGINTVLGSGWLGKFNTFFGYKAGLGNTEGYKNVFIGYYAGLANSTGNGNTFVGEESGLNNSTGYWNVFLGQYSGRSNISGNVNVIIGQNAGSSNQTGSGNVIMGENACHQDIAAVENVYLGKRAGMEVNGSYNIMIGSEAGGANYMGTGPSISNTILIGRKAGFTPSGSNNILIGNDSDIDASDCILLGNSLTSTVSNILKIDDGINNTRPLIYGVFNTDLVGINSVAPSANLHIKQVGAAEEGLAIENDGDTDTWSWEIGANDLQLFFNGTYVGYWNDADGSYNTVSDSRLKRDVEVLHQPFLDKIMKLELVSYRLLHAGENEQKTIGFIAQDVQKYFPELVRNREDGYLSLNYDDFGIIAIKAIQEQSQIIDELTDKSNVLEEKINQLKTEIDELKAIINKQK